MKLQNPFRSLTKAELALWLGSVAVIMLSFLLSEGGDPYSLIASLIGVTSLIFIAKGMVIGQVLMVVFSVFYGVISYFFTYYGEMITYLCMTAPIAVASMIAWIRHPYKDTSEVKVSRRLTKGQLIFVVAGSAAATVAFYFILGALGNANLLFSTFSVTTSFAAASLTMFRSPYYAIGYALNDVVLIVLWVMAAAQDSSYIPMVVCFALFFINDLYGFFSWKKMMKRQQV